MRVPEPSHTWHIAKAYPVQAAAHVPLPGPARGPVAPPGAGDAVVSASDPSRLRLGRLVAGVVPGGIDFTAEDGPVPRADAIPFYRHPAERNSAATGVETGRRLDARA